MSKVLGFRDLRVWQHGMNLVEQVYRISHQFPRHEIYGLTSQIRRAAVSIPANIAEDYTRAHLKEYLQFLSMAQASLAELQTEMEVAIRLEYVKAEQGNQTLDEASSLAKQIHSLRSALAKRTNTQHPAPGTEHCL